MTKATREAPTDLSVGAVVEKDNVLSLYKQREAGTMKLATGEQLPAFMRDDVQAKTGLAEMRGFVRPPRLKILQPMTQGEITEHYGVGDAVLLPSMQPVALMERDPKNGKPKEDGGAPFHFVPIMFWPEWCLWNPIQTRGTGVPMLEVSTMDPNSEVAKKARNPDTRLEAYPDNPEWKRRYVEHLNFLFLSLDVEEVHGTPFVVSFSRAEHKTGTTLMSMVIGRKAPPFGSIFSARVRGRTNEKGTWYGLTLGNPAEGNPRFVTHEDLYDRFKEMHDMMRDAVDSRKVVVDHEISEEEEAGEPQGTEF